MPLETKTIFLTSFHSFISKNILNSDVFKILLKNKIKIIILVPNFKKEFFNKNYASQNVIIEGIDSKIILNYKMNTFFSRLSFLLINSHYLWYKKKERQYHSKSFVASIKYFLELCFTKLFSDLKIFNKIFRFLDFYLNRKDFFKIYFEKYKPSCVFTADVFNDMDIAISRESKYRNVCVIGMVRSWDNAYSKGLLRILPDKLIVNNEIVKEEMMSLHNVRGRDICVAGLPQFDGNFSADLSERKEFFNEIGADLNKKIILIAPAGAILSDTDWQICQILRDAINGGLLPSDIQFLVRNHPNHPADLKRFLSDNRFIIEVPGVKFDQGSVKDVELAPTDIRHLANSLYYSEMVIYVATSIGLDSLIFNKPQIIIDFDGWENKPYIESVKKYHDEDHMKKLINTGGVKVAKNMDELISYINAYLKNPKLDEEGRKRMIREQLWKLDGRSGERIANFILEMINK